MLKLECNGENLTTEWTTLLRCHPFLHLQAYVDFLLKLNFRVNHLYTILTGHLQKLPVLCMSVKYFSGMLLGYTHKRRGREQPTDLWNDNKSVPCGISLQILQVSILKVPNQTSMICCIFSPRPQNSRNYKKRSWQFKPFKTINNVL